ncbi:MAG: hypothetical protein H7Z43_07530 [Clostridia bacterium]|nr:hypothetical protein [Deltaproteobacteria bacterium]
MATFRLAIPKASVQGVLTDVITGCAARFHGERVAVVDLAALFANAHRLVAPFAVAVEHRGRRAIVAVDSVAPAYLMGTLVAMPKLGLLRPDLFEGALRVAGEIVLVLAPRSLVTL